MVPGFFGKTEKFFEAVKLNVMAGLVPAIPMR
jgi:hypothetical protein